MRVCPLRRKAENPDRFGGEGPRWADNLEELDRLTMSAPAKQRVLEYRQRLRERGYRVQTINMPPEAHERLRRLAQQTNLAYGELVAVALEKYEKEATP